LIGKVKFFNKDKGYGFIIGSDSKDYFFHIMDVKDCQLVEYGNEVEFVAENGPRGLKATNIFKQKEGLIKHFLVHQFKGNKRTPLSV